MDTNTKQQGRAYRKRRRYTDGFKRDAVNRVLRTGKTCSEVGSELGINGNLLAKWRKKQIDDMDISLLPKSR